MISAEAEASPASKLFSRRVSVPSEVMASHLGGEIVLLNLTTETYFGLDEVGAAMWDAVTHSPSLEQAFLCLASEFDVDEETLSIDLRRFLDQLSAHGLIELVSPEQ